MNLKKIIEDVKFIRTRVSVEYDARFRHGEKNEEAIKDLWQKAGVGHGYSSDKVSQFCGILGFVSRPIKSSMILFDGYAHYKIDVPRSPRFPEIAEKVRSDYNP